MNTPKIWKNMKQSSSLIYNNLFKLKLHENIDNTIFFFS